MKAGPIKITVVAFEGCMTSAVFGLLDAFSVAARLAPKDSLWSAHDIRLATPSGQPVYGFGDRLIQPQCSLAEAVESDVVIVPAIAMDLVGALSRERKLVDWLAAFSSKPTLLASACTGAFLLAEAKVLDGHVVTTNPYYSALFKERYPDVQLALARRIVADRKVICAGSTTAVLDLGVYLIERLGGHELAVSTAKALSIDKNPSSQRPYLLFVAPREHGDERVLHVQEWIETNHTTAIKLEQIAAIGNMSMRNLARRFQTATGVSPMQYLRVVRIETAKRLLETKQWTVAKIAAAVGYVDTRAFGRAFRAEVTLSPQQYRRKFETRTYES